MYNFHRFIPPPTYPPPAHAGGGEIMAISYMLFLFLRDYVVETGWLAAEFWLG